MSDARLGAGEGDHRSRAPLRGGRHKRATASFPLAKLCKGRVSRGMHSATCSRTLAPHSPGDHLHGGLASGGERGTEG